MLCCNVSILCQLLSTCQQLPRNMILSVNTHHDITCPHYRLLSKLLPSKVISQGFFFHGSREGLVELAKPDHCLRLVCPWSVYTNTTISEHMISTLRYWSSELLDEVWCPSTRDAVVWTSYKGSMAGIAAGVCELPMACG